MKLALQVEGLPEALRAIDRYNDRLASRELANECMESAREFRDLLRAAAPVETGLLRRSIRAFRLTYRNAVMKGAIVWHQYATNKTEGANYAHIVSFGSKRGQKPNPYFANTVEAHGARITDGLASRIRAYLDKTGYF